MDELRTLRDVWPTPDDRQQVRQAGRDRLAEVAAGEAGHPAGRRRAGRNLTIGIVAAAAVAAGVLVTISGSGAPATARAPADKSPVAIGSPPAPGLQVLLTAAESAAKAPATTGTYWLTDVVAGGAQYLVDGKDGKYPIGDHGQMRLWYHSTPNAVGTVYEQSELPFYGPEGTAATAAWRKAGSPTHWTVKGKRVGSQPHGWAGLTQTGKQGAKFTFLDGTFEQLSKLPTDPAALRSYLLRRFRTGNSPQTDNSRQVGNSQQTDNYAEAGELFLAAINLLCTEPVSPKVRAAAYKMLAGVPGIRSVGAFTDPLGRHGVAVAAPRQKGEYADQQELLVINPSNGQMLADEWVSTTDGPLDGGRIPAGTPLRWVAPVTSAWTDKPPPGVTGSHG